ncbi:hypothetical protein JNUCC1_01233 [Lentibacillus sp. JNUCC-1]|nr:hypothetical protein [Lentibacillus sp. JNUCC-1]
MNSRTQKNKQEPENQSIEAMEKELEYLRMENAYLKKLRALVQEDQSPTKPKQK